jgi:hypothetical protein
METSRLICDRWRCQMRRRSSAISTTGTSSSISHKIGAEFVGYIGLAHHNGLSKSERWRVTRENWLRLNPPDSGS